MGIVTHTDADGVISAALALQKLKTRRIYFSSPFMLGKTLAVILKSSNFEELYVFDISPSPESVSLASIFSKVVWIDHHICSLNAFPENFEVSIKKAPSAASLVADYFDVDSPLVDLANQIDTNQVKDEEAAWLRDYIAALRFNFKGIVLSKALKNLVLRLASLNEVKPLIENEVLSTLVRNYRLWLEHQKSKIKELTNVFELNGKKIAVVSIPEGVPPYVVVDELAKLPEAPFDLITTVLAKDGFTHLEFRTHTGFRVVDLARYFGGGGHGVAAGATVESSIDIIDKIKRFFNEKEV